MAANTSFNHRYWENRYQDKLTGWDIGYASTPLKEYIDQLPDKSIKILIPGAGNAYEAGYLWEEGFVNTYILDFAESPLSQFQQKYPQFPDSQLIQDDFFRHEGAYDLILEQTFFCAIDPSLRSSYVKKTNRLLKRNGKLVGLLWNKPMNIANPPFGGSVEEYQGLFENDFEIRIMETAHNSIPPRQGNEVFINFQKKDLN